MTGHGAKFGRKMESAIAALVTRQSIEDAARVAGVAEKTLRRWMREPEFKTQYLRARREGVTQAVARMQHATGAAGTIILKLMTDPNVPAAVRLRAAECVFDRAIRGGRLTQLETRLTPSDPRVLTITVTRIGKPDEIIEMHLPEPNGRPRPWPPRRNGGPLARELGCALEAILKTILRRLQQLEERRSESLAANDASGARERILARINGMAEPLRDPNWEAMPKPSVEEVRQRLQEALSRHKDEADQPTVVRGW